MSQLVILKSPKEIVELTKKIEKDATLVSFDTETTGVDKGSEVIGYSICFSEEMSYYVILAEWNSVSLKLVYNIEALESSKQLITLLKTKSLIMHNAIFDCSIVKDYFEIDLIDSLHTDTMILAHLLDENRRVGLKDLAKQYFGEDADKEARVMKDSILKNGGSITKANMEMYKADSKLLAEYGAKDALLTFKLFYILVDDLYSQNLDKFFYEDESMPLLKGPTYELNTIGLKVDTNALLKLKKTLQAECEEAKAFIYKEITPHVKDKYPGTSKKNTFNIGAAQQLTWLLFERLGLPFGNLTDSGKAVCKDLGINKLPYTNAARKEFIQRCKDEKGSIQQAEVKTLTKTVRAKKFKDPWCYMMCDKNILKKLAPDYKWIDRLLEYQKKNKMLTTYVKGLEERLKYGVIRPSFLQHGTTSGRYSSRNPNFQNLPRDDKRIKACVVARPGKVFVGADYSQLEPRVFAYCSNDERLLKAFKGSDDFYSVIGMEVYDKIDCTPRKDGSSEAFGVKYKKLRDLSKVIALASTYGATARQLAPTTGKSIEDTQEDINNYFERFPDVKEMMLKSHEMAKTQGFVENIFGRKRRMPDALKINRMYPKIKNHEELPYEARNVLNLAVNHRIQSTAASIVNRSAIRFHEFKTEAKLDCQLVTQVHDSLIVECNQEDAQQVKVLLQRAMEETIDLKTIKLEAEPKIGTNFSEV